MDKFITGRPINIQHLRGDPDFQIIVHDASEPLFVDGLIDNALHFASPASPVDYVKSPIQTLKIGTHVALGIAKGVRRIIGTFTPAAPCYTFDPRCEVRSERLALLPLDAFDHPFVHFDFLPSAEE